MRRIAIFHCGFIYTGGGERIVMEEIKGLRKRGFDIDCYVPNVDRNLSYPDVIDQFRIKTFLPQLANWMPYRLAIQMLGACLLAPVLAFKFRNYDGFLGANQPGAYLAWVIARILNKPYWVYLNQPNRVLYPRDHEDWQNVKDYYFLNWVINKLFKPVVAWLDKKSITGGQELLINGSFVAQEIVKVYQPKSWLDCPAGAWPVEEKAVRYDRFKGQVKVNGWQFRKPYILYTSRHEPWKKFNWAIKVFSQVVKKYPGVRLIIPGAETTVTPKLKALAKKLKVGQKVIFTGSITQKSLWRLYQHACVYLFTSPKEDLGIVVEEAQAAGVPVVAWNRGGPTVTVVDGQTGYLIKPYDLNKMTAKILYLLKQPQLRDKLGRQAWQHIKKNFSWEKHVKILAEIINRELI